MASVNLNLYLNISDIYLKLPKRIKLKKLDDGQTIKLL